MKIFRSVRENKITQSFGENKLPYYKQIGMLGHNGIDFACRNGAKIYWDVDQKGKVLENHIDNAGGLGVIIVTRDTDGQYYKHRFWHLKSFKCVPGQIINTGTIIGYADNTGNSTGSHVHRDLKKVSKNENGNYVVLNKDNGYFGAIDPKPFLVNKFVVDIMTELLGQSISLIRKVIILFQRLRSYI